MLAAIPPGRMLEVGPGAGALALEAKRAGFEPHLLETSEAARELAVKMFEQHGEHARVYSEPAPTWLESFDVICSFEVLEHIENDEGTLIDWFPWLKRGGWLLLSVPAHMRLWSAGDEWAGHFRRYERKALADLVMKAGFQVEALECYGFPLSNLSERLSARSYRRRLAARRQEGNSDRRSDTEQSGIDRGPLLRIFRWIDSPVGRIALRSCLALQHLTTTGDIGTGYLIRARKR